MRPVPLSAVLGASVVAALAATSTVAIAAANGGLSHSGYGNRSACAAPALPGTVVDVTLVDMGNMIGGGSTGNQMMGSTRTNLHMSPMRLVATPGTAVAGTISFRVHNIGARTHELVILPLQPGQPIGQRGVGADGRVDEAGSLGEASRNCGAGAGQGIAAGTTGWVTRSLPAGNYELVCNLAHHYAAGMVGSLTLQ